MSALPLVLLQRDPVRQGDYGELPEWRRGLEPSSRQWNYMPSTANTQGSGAMRSDLSAATVTGKERASI